MGPIRAACRIAGALGVLAMGMLSVLLPGLWRRIAAGFFRTLLRTIGARLVVHGQLDQPAGRGALVVSNHISWVDILAVNAVTPVRSLAKAEIAGWPVLGQFAARAGTLFVERQRLRRLPGTVAQVASALRDGGLVHVYAEGTTWCGRASGRFVSAPFQAAIDGGIPVRPIALRFRLVGGQETTSPAFIGTETLGSSVWRVARLRGLVVEVFCCAEIAPGRAAAQPRGWAGGLPERMHSVGHAIVSLQQPPSRPIRHCRAANRRELAALAQSVVRSVLGETVHVPSPTLVAPDTAQRRASTANHQHRASYPGKAMTYLDHAATTPMAEDAIKAMTDALARVGNASSLHSSGRRARRMVEEAREELAAAVGAVPTEVVFTAGGTESDNLAVKGLFWARAGAEPSRRRVLVSEVEHHAVLDSAEWLGEHAGAKVELLAVDRYGQVRPETLRAAIGSDPDNVALVSVMWANNEVGTINPIAELAAICADYGIPLHTDAVQAVGSVGVDFAASGASALTLTGHKLGGPYGVGALLLSRDANCSPLLHGGGQERDVRSGTLDVPGIRAFATAVRSAVANQAERAKTLTKLRDALVAGVLERVPDAVLNGPPLDGPRLPGNAHLTFPGCEGDSLLMLLDAKGIECSTGSACTAGVAQPSHVLLAMGADAASARASLRFTLGHTSTRQDVDTLLAEIEGVVARARKAAAVGARA